MSDTLKHKKRVHVVLVYPDFTEVETSHRSLGNYSEGLASISAVLKQNGYDVSLSHWTYMPGREEYMQKIAALKPDIVGFSVRTTAFPDVRIMSEWTKACTDALTVAGGYHAILVPDELLACPGIDAVAVGEGEMPMLELCRQYEKHGGIVDYQVGSMYFKTPDGVIKNPVMPLIEDLDSLPFPDHELFDFPNLSATRMDTALVMVSRGCIFRCTYCGNSQFRNIYPNRAKYARFRSPDKAVELVQGLLHKYPNIKFINFRDAIINMFPKWFEEFIVLYRDNIGLPFTCNLRFDILKEEHVRLLKEAGCYMIDVGLESGDPDMRRDYLERNMTDQNMIDACHWFKKYGIMSLTYNIIGLPFEDIHKALKTIKLNAKLESDRVIPNIFYPYPMTKLSDIAQEAGFVDRNPKTYKRVLLRQPQFPPHDVIFIERFFQPLVRRYRRIYAMPPQKAARAEARLDKLIASKYFPRRLLAALGTGYDKAYRFLRRALLSTTPGLYKKLRAIRNRKRAA